MSMKITPILIKKTSHSGVKMNYSISETGSDATVALSGTLTFDDHKTARELMRALTKGDATSVIYDLSKVSAIDSSGIGLLLMANDRLAKASKTMKIRGATGAAARALELAKVGDLVAMSQ